MSFKLLRIIFCWFLLLIVFQSGSLSAYAGRDDTVHKVRLVWDSLPDAVMYEVVITDKPGAGSSQGSGNIILTKNVSAPGVELDGAIMANGSQSLWWQVRALNLDLRPISAFTPARKLEEGEFDPAAPRTTADLDKLAIMPLYPAYSWIPVLNASDYQVQILSAPAQSDNSQVSDILIRSYKINNQVSFDCYDEHAYTEEGTYWWRVAALDQQGRVMGNWSESLPFIVQRTGTAIATLGDSVTHGGGAVSNPPCDPAYSWTTYVGFPVRNLGKSGDTTGTMAERFRHDVLPFHPEILLIMGGVNDIRGGTRAAEVIENLSVIREQCRDNGIIPVFLTLTPVNPAAIKRVFNQASAPDWQEEWSKVNNWIKKQPYFVDIAPLLVDDNGLLAAKFATDGLHPDTQGKSLIGHAVGEYLQINFSGYVNKNR